MSNTQNNVVLDIRSPLRDTDESYTWASSFKEKFGRNLKNFYGVSIKGVNCIIGKNGTGKTKILADLIRGKIDLLSDESSFNPSTKEDYIFIYAAPAVNNREFVDKARSIGRDLIDIKYPVSGVQYSDLTKYEKDRKYVEPDINFSHKFLWFINKFSNLFKQTDLIEKIIFDLSQYTIGVNVKKSTDIGKLKEILRNKVETYASQNVLDHETRKEALIIIDEIDDTLTSVFKINTKALRDIVISAIDESFEYSLYYKDEEYKDEEYIFSTGDSLYLELLVNLTYTINNLIALEKDEKKIILLLDEIDMCLHPDRQKRLFNILVSLCDILSPNHKRFTLIMTTHSPIFASDIPKINITYLDPTSSAYTIVKGEKREKIDGAFANNIHTIYKDSFYMEGLIGNFAVKKVIHNIIEPKKKLWKRLKKIDVLTGQRLVNIKNELFMINIFSNILGDDLLRRRLDHELDAIDSEIKLKTKDGTN